MPCCQRGILLINGCQLLIHGSRFGLQLGQSAAQGQQFVFKRFFGALVLCDALPSVNLRLLYSLHHVAAVAEQAASSIAARGQQLLQRRGFVLQPLDLLHITSRKCFVLPDPVGQKINARFQRRTLFHPCLALCCQLLPFGIDGHQFLLIGLMPLLGNTDQVGVFKQAILPEWRFGGDVQVAVQLAAHVFQQACGLLTQCLQIRFVLLQRFGCAVQLAQSGAIRQQAQHDLHQRGR